MFLITEQISAAVTVAQQSYILKFDIQELPFRELRVSLATTKSSAQ